VLARDRKLGDEAVYPGSQFVITINTNNCPAPIYVDNLHFTGTLTHR
jgi:hypothetical protein